MMQTGLCFCGRPLHYSDPAIEAYVERAIAELGPMVTVSTPAGTWSVPRHYIALHGIDEAIRAVSHHRMA